MKHVIGWTGIVVVVDSARKVRPAWSPLPDEKPARSFQLTETRPTKSDLVRC